MFRFPPSIVIALCGFFLVMAIINVIIGRRRQQDARAQGTLISWYKQASILTAIEYILLMGVLLLNLGMTMGWFPESISWFIVSLYVSLLVLAAIALGGIVFWSIRGTRKTSTISTQKNAIIQNTSTRQQQAMRNQKQRERRQKTRRKRAGRA